MALQTQKRRKIEKKNRNKKRRAFFLLGVLKDDERIRELRIALCCHCSLVPKKSAHEAKSYSKVCSHWLRRPDYLIGRRKRKGGGWNCYELFRFFLFSFPFPLLRLCSLFIFETCISKGYFQFCVSVINSVRKKKKRKVWLAYIYIRGLFLLRFVCSYTCIVC